MNLRKFIANLRSLFGAFPKDERVEMVRRNLLAEMVEGAPPETKPSFCVAVQAPHDVLFFGLFAALISDLRKHVTVDGYLLLVNSINFAIGTGLKQSFLRSFPYAFLVNSQWIRANHDFVDKVGYCSQSLRHPIGDLIDWFRAEHFWKLMQSSRDPAKLTVNDILIGDVVIDTYLRIKPSPKFEIKDSFVKKIIWQSLRDLRRSHSFFSMKRPAIYLTSYSTYIEHGIAVRVALKFGVKVHVYANPHVFGRILNSRHYFHTPETSDYRKIFNSLTNQSDRLVLAEQSLNSRLSGKIDTATSYMRLSAYAESDEAVPDVAGDVIVFLHDFYDSPHIYANLVFTDFWTWIVFTIETLKTAGISFWIKPHPNQIAISDAAFNDLLELYPDLRVISPKITNAQLVKGGIKCGITVYGTVAHELAFMGVPSIGCARHPHHAFDFCRTAYTRDEFKELLINLGVGEISKEEMRVQALQFFYMHNLHGEESELLFRAQLARYFKLAGDEGTAATDLSTCLEELRELPAWKKHVGQIADSLFRTQ